MEESSEHEGAHGEVDPGLLGGRERLVILAQATIPPQPGKGAFHHPTPWQHLKAGRQWGWFLARRRPDPASWLADHRHTEPEILLDPGHCAALISGIDPEMTQRRILLRDGAEHQPGSIPIAYISRVDHGFQH